MSKEDIIAGGNRNPPLRAPYNFVRLNKQVLPSPLGDDPSHAEPVAEHLSGEIDVAWQAETPLLVGGSDNDAPCRYGGDDGAFVIPGASLRGLTRATLEIASYARLDFVDDQLFGLRDFDSVTWQGVVNGVQNIKAGWLKKIEGEVCLSEVRYGRFAINEICAALTAKEVATTRQDWQEMSLPLRHSAVHAAGLQGRLLWTEHPALPATRYEKQGYKLGAGAEAVEGYLVVAGAANRPGEAGSNKEYETVFFGGFDDGKQRKIAGRAFERFKEIQIEDGRRHGDEASTNWSYLKKQFEDGEAIPVFFVGDPSSPDLALSLTRLMRVPFAHSVLDVARKTQPDLGNDGALDFVQALFGCTPKKDVQPDPAKPSTLPWKGRVFFRHAELKSEAPNEPSDPVDMVTMQPKPSFYPYYLRPEEGANATHPVDWSNPQARLAGRKRYPARNGVAAAVRAPGDDVAKKAEQESHPRFLPASRDEPLRFTSRIRLHNVSPIELGGLLFALTFGQLDEDDDQGYRHMLGRAKGYGYGQIRSWIVGQRLTRSDGGTLPSLKDCLNDFKTWVTDRLDMSGGSYEDLPEIKDLLALAHAATGEGLIEHLRLPSIPRESATDAEAILKAYQRIKKTTGTANNRAFAQDGANHPGKGRSDVSDQARDEEGFWFLPRY